MGFHLSRRSAGDELDHLRSIKLGANEKSEDKKKIKSLTFRPISTSKSYFRSLDDPSQGSLVYHPAIKSDPGLLIFSFSANP